MHDQRCPMGAEIDQRFMNRAPPAHVYTPSRVGGEQADAGTFEPSAKRDLLLIASAERACRLGRFRLDRKPLNGQPGRTDLLARAHWRELPAVGQPGQAMIVCDRPFANQRAGAIAGDKADPRRDPRRGVPMQRAPPPR